MFDTILVPVDGSRGASAAVEHAVALGQFQGATIHVLSVLDSDALEVVALESDETKTIRTELERRGRAANASAAERVAAAGFDAVRDLRDGDPYRTIRSVAREVDADVLVMGTRGHTALDSIRLGSTTERVVTAVDTPVLAVPPHPEIDEPHVDSITYDRLVVPVDGSDVSERAADVALDFAETVGASVEVLYVVDRTITDIEDAPRSIVGLLKEGGRRAVETVSADATSRGIPVRTRVQRGVPAEEILEYTTTVDGSLVAMGTRGRGETADRLLGSTTARVLRRADRPVLVS